MALHKSAEFLDGKGKPTNLSTGSFLSSSSSSSSSSSTSFFSSIRFFSFVHFYLLSRSLLTFFCTFPAVVVLIDGSAVLYLTISTGMISQISRFAIKTNVKKCKKIKCRKFRAVPNFNQFCSNFIIQLNASLETNPTGKVIYNTWIYQIFRFAFLSVLNERRS